MKKTYSAPTINLKLFAVENIVTDSAAVASQIKSIQSIMDERNNGETTLTKILSFNKWN